MIWPCASVRRTLIARKLPETRIVTCAAPAYLERRGAPQTPADVGAHEALLFRDPQSGRPFTWEFHRRSEVVEIAVDGPLGTDDPSTALAACEAGLGLFQSLELGLAPWLASGRHVQVLEAWAEERFACTPTIRRVDLRRPRFGPSWIM